VADSIHRGSVIWADLCDPDGNNLKDRPALVLLPQADIDLGRDLEVAVISTAWEYPLKPGWFEIESRPGGQCCTGLSEACVVKATWLEAVPQNKVNRVTGRAPRKLVSEVLNWLAEEARKKLHRPGTE